jgi:hypothetical protein
MEAIRMKTGYQGREVQRVVIYVGAALSVALGGCSHLYDRQKPGDGDPPKNLAQIERLDQLIAAPTLTFEVEAGALKVNGHKFERCAIPKRKDGRPEVGMRPASDKELKPCRGLDGHTVFSVRAYSCPRGNAESATCTLGTSKYAEGKIWVQITSDDTYCQTYSDPDGQTYTQCWSY